MRELRDRIGVGASVASELLVLAGGDVDMAEQCSNESEGLDQCKAAIIDRRFKRFEESEKAEDICWNKYDDQSCMFECSKCNWRNWDTTDSDLMTFCPGCNRKIVWTNK